MLDNARHNFVFALLTKSSHLEVSGVFFPLILTLVIFHHFWYGVFI